LEQLDTLTFGEETEKMIEFRQGTEGFFVFLLNESVGK
jgi:hypothetical protein